MDLGLRGKVAFVGGAASGLGEGVARGLAAEGASVILCARHMERLLTVEQAIRKEYGTPVCSLAADLRDAEQVRAVTAQALACHGPVDILFSNTGGPPAGRFEELDEDSWDLAYQGLLQSAVRLARGFLPGMRSRGWGRIIHSTSVAVKQPVDGLMLSNSLRAAVTGFSRTLANEVASSGITVNCVMPGYIRTARLDELAGHAARRDGISPEEAFGRWTASVPAGRIGLVREFADVVVFLASENASYVTGQSLAIDGGVVKSLY